MDYHILHTASGESYARKIARSLRWAKNTYSWGSHIGKVHSISVNNLSALEFIESNNPENTIIHARAAHPDSLWMSNLIEVERAGFKVINSTDTLKLTSNKLECALRLQDRFPHPKTWEFSKKLGGGEIQNLLCDIRDVLNSPRFLIAKPLTSINQGLSVKKIDLHSINEGHLLVDEFMDAVSEVPGERIVVQEYIPYTAIYRVIVIGGRALPFSFVDKPEWKVDGEWKVSVCLNRASMRLVENPPYRLLRLAEMVQEEIKGEINFIDFFEQEYSQDDYRHSDRHGKFTISEINTACNLSIHEGLARVAGIINSNIHYQISKYLAKKGE